MLKVLSKKSLLYLLATCFISLIFFLTLFSTPSYGANYCNKGVDPDRCNPKLPNWVQVCRNCDAYPNNEWCNTVNCAATGKTCLNGACQAPADTTKPVVSAFDVQPRTTTGSVTATYTVTDYIAFQTVELWRAGYDIGGCDDSVKTACVWSQIQTRNISGVSRSGNFTDAPSGNAANTYWYGLHVLDNSNNLGNEPTSPGPIKIIIAPPGTTITAASPAYIDVSAAVAQANNGDTVIVPAGTATWTNSLTITKAINLQGAGRDRTVITGQLRLIQYFPDASASQSHGTFTLNGFTLDGNYASAIQANSAGLLTVANADAANYVNVVVVKNSFRNGAVTGIWLQGMIFGVASTNDFDKIASPIRAFGLDDRTWANLTQQYGTAQNFFFEDNTIHFSSFWNDGGFYGWLESGAGGRIVVRYNTWDETNAPAEEYWDIHGLQNGGTSYTTMIAEYYGNKISNESTSYRWMYDRGGWALMFDNILNRSGSGGGVNQVKQYYCDSTQISGNYKQKVSNSYFWSNLFNGKNSPAVVNSDAPNCDTDPIVENVDFFNYNPSCTANSCASGMGIGSQIPTGSCTTGVGYWYTAQTSLVNSTGAKPATPISGTLYKCTAANSWSPYYTPYTYPHPLTR